MFWLRNKKMFFLYALLTKVLSELNLSETCEAIMTVIGSVLCLQRDIAIFPWFYRRCHLKMHPVRVYGHALKIYADFSLFKSHFRI